MNNFKKLFLLSSIGSLLTTQISCAFASNDSDNSANNSYNVAWNYDNNQCQHSLSDNATIKKNEDYVDKITYKPGYVFDNIKIVFGTGEKATTYTESYNTNKSQLKWISNDFSTLTIPKDKIRANFSIFLKCRDKVNVRYQTWYDYEGSYSLDSTSIISLNEDYHLDNIKFDKDYEIDIGNSKITINDKLATNGKEYHLTSNDNTVQLTIYNKYIVGDISILLAAKPIITYGVVLYNGDHYTLNGNDEVSAGQDYVATIDYDDGYELDDITITIAGSVVDDSSYKLSENNTKLTIFANNIKGNIDISLTTKATTIISDAYNVQLNNGDHYTLNGNDQVSAGQDYVATIDYDDGYELDNITIKIAGLVVDDSSYKLSDNNTKLTIFANNIKGNIDISLTTKATTIISDAYNVQLNNGDKYILRGKTNASAKNDYVANIDVIDTSYEIGLIKIMVGNKLLTNDSYIYDVSNHSLTIYGSNINGDISISCIAYLKIDETFLSTNLSSKSTVKHDKKNNCIWIFDNGVIYKKDLATNSIIKFSNLRDSSIYDSDIADISINGFNIVVLTQSNLGIYFSSDGGVSYNECGFSNNNFAWGQYTIIDNNDNLWVIGGCNWQGLFYATLTDDGKLTWNKCTLNNGSTTSIYTEGNFNNIVYLNDNVWLAYYSLSDWDPSLISFDNGKTWQYIDYEHDDTDYKSNFCSTYYFDKQNNELLLSTYDRIYSINISTRKVNKFNSVTEEGFTYNPYMQFICQGTLDDKSYLFFLTKPRWSGEFIQIYAYDKQEDEVIDITDNEVFSNLTINSMVFIAGHLVVLTSNGLRIQSFYNDIKKSAGWSHKQFSTNFISFINFSNNMASFIAYEKNDNGRLNLTFPLIDWSKI